MAIDGVTSCMKIREVNKNKKQFISLLLLADEQESMVDRYLEKGTMYVLEEDGEFCASMILNHFQAEEYGEIDWIYPGEGEEILVIHTLCIPPQKAGRGYGQQMVDYVKEFARELGCKAIRIDTYAHNEPAKSLYKKNGFRIAGYYESLLEGLIKEELAFLEYKI